MLTKVASHIIGVLSINWINCSLIDTEDHASPVNAASMMTTPSDEDTLERVVTGMTAGYAPQESSSGQI